MPSLANTAGESEREKRSRLFNLLEGLGVITLILIVQWPVAFAGDILGGMRWITPVVQGIIGLVFFFILLVSPRLHGDTLNSWGLGSPRAIRVLFSEGSLGKRIALAAVILAIFVALNVMNFQQWPFVAKFLSLHKLGIEPDPLTWHEAFPGRYAVFAAGAAISFLVTGFLIRYDNFFTAFKTALRVSLPFLLVLFLAAWLHLGGAAFANMSLASWAIGVLGYVFWGAIQQLVFSGYFGTRFRRAFAPGNVLENEVAQAKRAVVTITFGGGFAVVGILAIAGTIAWVHGANRLNPGVLAWLTALLFIGGLAYGRWYCRDKRRLLVATLSGACFGLIHIDSFGLVFLTWGLGTVLVYVFMEESNRNVVALGFIHGLLGSTLSTLFSKNRSGALEIDYHVGPWNIEEPAWGALIFPGLWIVTFMALMAWAIRNRGRFRD